MFSKRYKDSLDFHNNHQEKFDLIISASSKLKSMNQLGETGNALGEAERLTFEFLHLGTICSELLFGLTGSTLDAKSKIKQTEGIFFRDLSVKTSAIDKAKLVQCLPAYMEADRCYNDLLDLSEYIAMKKKDFEAAYYYYRDLSNRK